VWGSLLTFPCLSVRVTSIKSNAGFGLRLAAIVGVSFDLCVQVFDESRISFVDCDIELRQQRIKRFRLLDQIVCCAKCFALYSAWQISFSCSGSE